jgi:uncharacterized protein YuzE
MKQPYLEVSYRRGRAMAAYLYLPREAGDVSVKTLRAGDGILVDFAAGDRPIGVEITSPSRVTVTSLNAALAGLGVPPLEAVDLSPACAA